MNFFLTAASGVWELGLRLDLAAVRVNVVGIYIAGGCGGIMKVCI